MLAPFLGVGAIPWEILDPSLNNAKINKDP